MSKQIKRYRHTHSAGFSNPTLWCVEVDGDKVWCVYKNGLRQIAPSISLKDVELFIKEGWWAEIK